MNYKKFISLITLLCFLLIFVIRDSFSSFTNQSINPISNLDIKDKEFIPLQLGRITSGECFNSKRFVIYIQDLHCNPEVQKNISNILKDIHNRFKIKRLFIEGAFGTMDDSWIRAIEDSKLKKGILDALIDRGELKGSEYFAAFSDGTCEILGLENEEIYKQNIQRLAKIIRLNANFQSIIEGFESKLRKIEKEYYSKQHERFRILVKRYEKGVLDTKKFYFLIYRLSNSLNIDFQSCRNFYTFLEILNNKNRYRYHRIASDFKNYITYLKNNLSYERYQLIISKTNNFSNLYNIEDILSEVAPESLVLLHSKYRDLSYFLRYLKLSQSINPIRMLEEEKALIKEIDSALSRNQSEYEVSFLWKDRSKRI